jgi:ubiquinone/menaquinone biosynthesis C-methylase UbiE
MNTTKRHMKQDPVVKEYSRLAPEYDTRWSFYVEATTSETIARLQLPEPGRVLDVGCGTGLLLQKLAHKFPQATLVGVDPVQEMLAIARERVAPGTELREGWAEELPCEDNSFDVVVSCNMFHYVREPISALTEMSRVLRPGGELIITDWCDDYLACRVCDWWLRLFSPAHVKVYRERECLRLLKEAGHPEALVERYKINWLWGVMTVRATKHLDTRFEPRRHDPSRHETRQ